MYNHVTLYRLDNIWDTSRKICHRCNLAFRKRITVYSRFDIGTFFSDILFALNTDKSFPSLIKSTRNLIVFTIFRLIWSQTDVSLDLNQSVYGKYNLISVWFNKSSERFICVYFLHYLGLRGTNLIYHDFFHGEIINTIQKLYINKI